MQNMQFVITSHAPAAEYEHISVIVDRSRMASSWRWTGTQSGRVFPKIGPRIVTEQLIVPTTWSGRIVRTVVTIKMNTRCLRYSLWKVTKTAKKV